MRMRSLFGVALLAVVCAGFASSAHAQQINGVLKNNSILVAQWRAWDSIYGTNMPTGPGMFVRIRYPAIHAGGVGSDYSDIRSSSSFQTYWYESPTQINLYIYAQNILGGTAVGGCAAIPFGGLQCNETQVCKSGTCTNNFVTTFSGLP